MCRFLPAGDLNHCEWEHLEPQRIPVMNSREFVVEEFDLDATLGSGQAFRWWREGSSWTGVVGSHWVSLSQASHSGVLRVKTARACEDWQWLRTYLQLDCQLADVLNSFPKDDVLLEAVGRWRGLRLLRQDPWECLATFILSSTKQIVQIQQIVSLLCSRFGEVIAKTDQGMPVFAFPTAERLASVGEGALRDCKMGFRAPNLLGCAKAVSEGSLDLEAIRLGPLSQAREGLMRLPGVGPKIADCALLFAFGFAEAFPVDVWVARVLRDYYFEGRPVPLPVLRSFVVEHFGPHAGYAQQYLFHHIRMLAKNQ